MFFICIVFERLVLRFIFQTNESYIIFSIKFKNKQNNGFNRFFSRRMVSNEELVRFSDSNA